MVLNLFAASFFALCLFAAARDLRTLTIPNWLNGWLAFLFIPACIIAAPGWETVGWHVLAGVIAFAVSVVLFMLGVFGGGDAKMIPGIMLWIGPAGTYPFLTGMLIFGGALAVLVMIARALVPVHATPGFAYETLQRGNGVPYGVAIIIGGFLGAEHSPFLTGFLSQISSFS